ncbi:MAG TPA: hypothetical protein VGL51_05380 [Solirubrobacteraceae bacterium]|jgi:hypothetical protein
MVIRADRSALLRGLARAAVVPAAAFGVHQLRYSLAFGGAAAAELQRQGHSYLHSLVPWIVLLLALAVGGFLSALGRAMAGQKSLPRFGCSFLALWLTCAICLLAIYAAQELLEGLFLTGHPAGLSGVFGYGGWWAVPAALSVGLVLAALLHGARWVLAEVAARCTSPAADRRLPARCSPRPPHVLLVRLAPLATGWCGRGPPG